MSDLWYADCKRVILEVDGLKAIIFTFVIFMGSTTHNWDDQARSEEMENNS